LSRASTAQGAHGKEAPRVAIGLPFLLTKDERYETGMSRYCMDTAYTGNGARLSLFLKITERVLTCGPTFGPTRTIDGSTCGPAWKKSCPYHQLARLRADAFPRNRGRVRSDNTCHSGVQRREHAPQSCIFRCPQQAKTPPREIHTWRTPKRVQFS
jgi:hypothetical protein